MTRNLVLWVLAALLVANLARGPVQAGSNDGQRIATALEQLAREVPRIRQALEKQATCPR